MHPLQLITGDEIEASTHAVRNALALKSVTGQLRWIEVNLEEPSTQKERQQLLLDSDATSFGSCQRKSKVIVYHKPTNKTYECVVQLVEKFNHKVDAIVVEGPTHIPGVQPAFTPADSFLMENICKAHEGLQRSLAKRGIDIDRFCCDAWCAGYFSPKDSPTRRLSKPMFFIRNEDDENGECNIYGRPLEGISMVIDLQLEKVVEFNDFQMTPIPGVDETNAWIPDKSLNRTTMKPLHVTQPKGISFTIDDGNRIQWEGWKFRVGFTGHEGIALQTITYADPLKPNGQGSGGFVGDKKVTERPVAFRISVAEMVVPYGDPNHPHYLKNAFDAGEDGLGRNAHTLEPDGCDCLGEIRYLDAAFVDVFTGKAEVIKNAVCIHEEDMGVLWKHKDWRTDHTEVRRGRRLVVSFFCTIANYEYGFYYHFGQDGKIELEVKLTGILSTGALSEHEKLSAPAANIRGRKYGTTLNPKGLFAPIHQHFFVARIDPAVDGLLNSVVEVEVKTSKQDKILNPYHNAFYAEETLLKTELDGVRKTDVRASRHWKVISGQNNNHDSSSSSLSASSPAVLNRTGFNTSYALIPYTHILPMASSNAHYLSRAGFLLNNLWVTPYNKNEKYPGGNYPNQRDTLDGLPLWTQQNRNLVNEDLVLWHVFGITHVPRLEDWPVMPCEKTGFEFRPVGFFDSSPCLDVPKAMDIPGQQLLNQQEHSNDDDSRQCCPNQNNAKLMSKM